MTDVPTYEAITVDLTDGVATVTLNRPEHLNAWNADVATGLSGAMRWCDDTDDVRAVVVTGAGRAFCAGADLSGGGDTFASRRNEPSRPAGADDADADPTVLPWHVRKPVIAAINGHAVGVGATYPMTCDMRFAATDAKIAFVFVRRGMLPELASHAVLPRIVGMSHAADLLLTGRPVTGEEAAAMGLVSAALPRDEVLAAAQERARMIAVHSAPVSVAVSKRLLWNGLNDSIAEMQAKEGPVFAWFGRQSDAVEGIESFLEKRDPDWGLSVATDYPGDLAP